MLSPGPPRQLACEPQRRLAEDAQKPSQRLRRPRPVLRGATGTASDGKRRPGRPRRHAAAQAPAARRSIFQTDWWLDAVTDGNWTSIAAGDAPDCRAWLPLWPVRQNGQRMLSMPPMTRTLGPVVQLVPAKQASLTSQRCELMQQLIAALPPHDVFHQVFEAGSEDAFAFATNGFAVYTQYTFTLDATRATELLWAGLKDKVRNRVRRGMERYSVEALDLAHFYDFYEENLKRSGRAKYEDLEAARRAATAAEAHGACAAYAARSPRGALAAAVLLVWDAQQMYYLQATRDPVEADSTAASLLVWKAIERAHALQLSFDFDGFATRGGAHFVSAFGGTLAQRPVVVARRG